MTAAMRGITPVPLVLLLVIAGGCAAASPSTVARPSTPPGWTTVESDAGDLRLDLPPWIVPFDTSGPVFANEKPGEDGAWIQVLAQGPGAANPEPSSATEAEAWLASRIASPIAGPATVRTVELPGGTAIRIDRVDGAGTPQAWRFAALAFRTPAGLAALIIDGPVDAWEGRESDLELILQLVRFGPGHGGPAAPRAPEGGVAPVLHEAPAAVEAPRPGDPPVAP